MRIDRRDRIGLVVALLVAAICVGLGVWQLDRLHDRRQRNALLLAARARRPVRLVFQERQPDRSAALRREAALRRLSRGEKVALVRAGR